VKLTYCGPHEAVTILATGQTAQRGVAIDVADDDVAAQLIHQGWEIPRPAKKAATAVTTTKAVPAATEEDG